MKEKYCFIEKITKTDRDERYKCLRVLNKTHDEVRALSKETGQDITVISQILVDFALQHVRIVDNSVSVEIEEFLS